MFLHESEMFRADGAIVLKSDPSKVVCAPPADSEEDEEEEPAPKPKPKKKAAPKKPKQKTEWITMGPNEHLRGDGAIVDKNDHSKVITPAPEPNSDSEPGTWSIEPSKPRGRKRTATTNASASGPAPKSSKLDMRSAVPANETPRQADAMEHPALPSGAQMRDSTPEAPANRLVQTHGTNAPLLSPSSYRLTTQKPMELVSPSKPGREKLSTENVLEKACEHLIKMDQTGKLKHIIEKNPCRLFSREGLAEVVDPFVTLCSSIIGQQVSGAAAASIERKFIALFNTSAAPGSPHIFPKPSDILQKDIPTLRSAGLSQRKAEYISGLAQKFVSGELTTEFLMNGTYEEIFEKLIAVRGLGAWSVEMFACFGLKRLDVFSTGDLGVQRGMAALMGRDVGKLKNNKGKWKYMSEKEMLEISERFRPYRSLFMWYMWRVEEVDVSFMEKA